MEKVKENHSGIVENHNPHISPGLAQLASAYQTTHPEIAAFIKKSGPALVEQIGYNLTGVLSETLAKCGIYKFDKPFQALIEHAAEITDMAGVEVFSNVAVVGKNMSHVTWQVPHAVNFLHQVPKIIDRLILFFEEEFIQKFFDMLERLSEDNTNFSDAIASLNGYLDSLERCKELGIADQTLELTSTLAKADSIKIQHVLQYWIDFSESVYRFNTGTSDSSDQPGFSQAEYQVLLDRHLERITIEAEASPVTTLYLLGYGGKIIEMIGYDGLDAVLTDYIGKRPAITEQRSRVYLEVLSCSPDIIRKLLHLGDQKFVKEIYKIAGRMGRDFSLAEAIVLLKQTASITGKIGLDGLKETLRLLKKLIKSASDDIEAKEDFLLLLNETSRIIDSIFSHGGKQLVLEAYKRAERLLRHDPRLPYTYLSIAPALIATDGFKSTDRFLRILPHLDGNHSIARVLLRAIPEIIKHLGYEGILKSARLALKIWKHNDAAALIFIERLPVHMEKLNQNGLVRLADKIIEVSISNAKNAELFARGETREYLDYCDLISEGLHLKHVRHLLSNYLDALLGYRIEIRPADSADTDGDSVFLPRMLDVFKGDDKNLLLYKVLATHVEAHIEFGSFDFIVAKVPDLVNELKAQYGLEPLPGDYGSDEEIFFSLFPERDLIRDLKDILEDFRIESRLKAVYPILGIDTRRMNRLMLKNRPELDKLSSDRDRSVEVIYQTLFAVKTREAVPENLQAILATALDIARPLLLKDADVHDTFRAAATLYRQISNLFEDPYTSVNSLSSPINQSAFIKKVGHFTKTAESIKKTLQLGENEPPPEDDKINREDQLKSDPSDDKEKKRMTNPDEPEKRQDLADWLNPEISLEELKQLLLELFKEKKITPKEIEKQIEELNPDQIIVHLKGLALLMTEDKERVLTSEHFFYPEWGNDINAYRANWTTVIENEVNGDDPDFYRETLEQYGGLIQRIRREFQVIRPEAMVKLKRQFDGHNIDFDAAIDYQIDLTLNITPSEKNYIQILKHHRDIAVAFLIDLSGSTSGDTIKREKQSLIMFSEALHELRDAFAIYGFTGYSRSQVDFFIVKDFAEIYNRNIQRRISGLTAGTNTREGAAIRHVTSKLKLREEKTKILLLLNDSQPFDEGYNGIYAIADTRKALFEAKKYGIRPFCLTITKNRRNLKALYSHNSWAVIDDVAKLPEKITRIYQKLTT